MTKLRIANFRLWNLNSELHIPNPETGCSAIRKCGLWGKNSAIRNPKSVFERGFTLIEIIVVIVILSIVSGITVKFLVDSMRIYQMTVNQKTLLDEGKLSLERMCRDIRDARSTTAFAGIASSVTFVRDNATVQDIVGEAITFQQNAGARTLEKVKASPAATTTMADNVDTFAVTNTTNEIQLQLTLLRLGTGENVTLLTNVYPKNLLKDPTHTYKNFYGNWKEVKSPDTF